MYASWSDGSGSKMRRSSGPGDIMPNCSSSGVIWRCGGDICSGDLFSAVVNANVISSQSMS